MLGKRSAVKIFFGSRSRAFSGLFKTACGKCGGMIFVQVSVSEPMNCPCGPAWSSRAMLHHMFQEVIYSLSRCACHLCQSLLRDSSDEVIFAASAQMCE